jgi:hypothetical protein
MYQPHPDADGSYIPPVPLMDTQLKDPNNLPIFVWHHPITNNANYVSNIGVPTKMVPVMDFEGKPVLDESG